MNILVWCEQRVSEMSAAVGKAYPQGLQQALADIFDPKTDTIVTAAQSDPDFGFPEAVLAKTDLVIYWAHVLHGKLPDEVVDRIVKRVDEGMGIIFLHSAHFSKPFQKIMGATGALNWREDGSHERLYNINPKHPIAKGIPATILLPHEEMYGEYFDIPTPDDIVFMGWYPGGELFRSGFTYHYGNGRVFYFQPGHETFRTYYIDNIKKIIYNAAMWVTRKDETSEPAFEKHACVHIPKLEKKLKCFMKK